MKQYQVLVSNKDKENKEYARTIHTFHEHVTISFEGHGILVISNVGRILKAYAPGEWYKVELVED